MIQEPHVPKGSLNMKPHESPFGSQNKYFLLTEKFFRASFLYIYLKKGPNPNILWFKKGFSSHLYNLC